jgi:hypothetical protein
MLTAICIHCNRNITYQQGDNGVWYEETKDVQLGAQYCWMDPVNGSKLHQPNTDTIRDNSSIASAV